MAGSVSFDDLELKIIHALQADGRAPFSKIAGVLGVSDQTVARRYASLRSAKKIRVTGRTDPAQVGEISWFVRVRCIPDAARAIGEALARRPDTSWVKLTSGGTEIVAIVRAPAGHDSQTFLLEKLPRTPRVLDVSANCLLHVFYGGPRGFIEALSPEQVAKLQLPPAADAPQLVLDEGDRQMLAFLERDGRMDFTALATATGRPATTLRRRLADLRASGVLYFDVDFDYRSLGMTSQTMIWLSVAPDQMVAAGQALAAHPEVPFAAATTGSTNLFASSLCPDPSALYTYLTTKVATLPSIQRMETAPVLQTLKNL